MGQQETNPIVQVSHVYLDYLNGHNRGSITHHSYNPEGGKSNSWSYFRSKNGNSGDILRSCSSLVLSSEQKGWETALPNS